MVKIALDAGHGLYTPGKRCLKSIDPNETREWTLNNRVMTKLQGLLAGYQDVEMLRVDDPTGQKDISLYDRVKRANDWKADLYLSDHKNAGINGGSGGGLVVFRSTNASAESTRLQKILYNHLIATTGLRGNRSNSIPAAQFYVIYRTTMPALLIEGGFMDSRTDTPIILTDAFAEKMAQGYLNFLVEVYNLKKKPEPVVEKPLPDGTLLRVVVGTYSLRSNAVEMQARLKAAGFESFIAVHNK